MTVSWTCEKLKSESFLSLSFSTDYYFRFDCYYAAVDVFHERCFNVGRNDYALRMLNTLVNLCERGYQQEEITSALLATCRHPHMYGIH